MTRCLEGPQDVGVHLDGEVTIFHEALVPRLHGGKAPVSEGLAREAVRQVDDELPGKAATLFQLGQILFDGRVLARLNQELLDAETLVLGHGQVLDAVGVKELFPAGNQGLEKVDGHAVVRRQVRPTLDRGEVVPEESS